MLYSLTPGLLASVAAGLFYWNGNLAPDLASFVSKSVFALYLGGFVTGMGRVLLSAQRPSWRLPPIPSTVALKLAWLPLALGIMVALTWMSQQLLGLINATLSTTTWIPGSDDDFGLVSLEDKALISFGQRSGVVFGWGFFKCATGGNVTIA